MNDVLGILSRVKQIEHKFFKKLEKKLWTAADQLRSALDVSVYKHVVSGPIFLKYVSDALEERQRELEENWILAAPTGNAADITAS